jgi:hypothetical protein
LGVAAALQNRNKTQGKTFCMKNLFRLCKALGCCLAFTLCLHPAQAATSLAITPPVISCDQLATIDFTKTAVPMLISAARMTMTPKGNFCQVTGTIAPRIGFEVYLPAEHWTQRFLQTGCGGLCGNININVGNAQSCTPALNGEFVVSSNDMGHSGSMMDASWAADPQKRIDFAYRANHLTALATKAIIQRYYGKPAAFSYFMGCSDGGREALMEAQRYPDDFDGISAGAPAAFFQFQNSFFHAWNVAGNLRADGTPILLKGKLPVLHRAVIEHCPTGSGVKDGLLANPFACKVDPAWVPHCKAGAKDTDQCLSSEEITAAMRLYAGATDARGNQFVLSGQVPGSELNWPVPATPDEQSMSVMMAMPALQYVLLPETLAGMKSLTAFPLTKNNFDRVAALAPLYNAANTNLRKFSQRGGKLIMWHGLADDSVSPGFSIAYYRGVQKLLGTEATDRFLRLFLLPGVGHCGHGEGYDQIDLLSSLMAWTEKALAPAMILSTKVAQDPQAFPPMGGKPPMGNGKPSAEVQFHGMMPASSPLAHAGKPPLATRPVYPFPYIARYLGQGNPLDAASYAPLRSEAFDHLTFGEPAIAYIGPDNQKNYMVRDGKLVVIQ